MKIIWTRANGLYSTLFESCTGFASQNVYDRARLTKLRGLISFTLQMSHSTERLRDLPYEDVCSMGNDMK